MRALYVGLCGLLTRVCIGATDVDSDPFGRLQGAATDLTTTEGGSAGSTCTTPAGFPSSWCTSIQHVDAESLGLLNELGIMRMLEDLAEKDFPGRHLDFGEASCRADIQSGEKNETRARRVPRSSAAGRRSPPTSRRSQFFQKSHPDHRRPGAASRPTTAGSGGSSRLPTTAGGRRPVAVEPRRLQWPGQAADRSRPPEVGLGHVHGVAASPLFYITSRVCSGLGSPMLCEKRKRHGQGPQGSLRVPRAPARC